jgi:hypothetical protein
MLKEEKMERKKITPVDIQAMKKEGKNWNGRIVVSSGPWRI